MGTALPSAADSALHTTDEKANFQRLTRLLVCGGITLLREVFDSIHRPADLPLKLGDRHIHTQLKSLKKQNVINQREWKILYPSPGVYGKSTEFDITLLFKLFRNICRLTRPCTGWDSLPNSANLSLGADLARIKFYRNEVYSHSNYMEISNAEFVDLWREISEALLRIAKKFSVSKKNEWKTSIDKFLRDPLTPDSAQSLAELQSWYKKDMDTKDMLEQQNQSMDIKLQKQMNAIMNIHTIVTELKSKQGESYGNSGHLPSAPHLQEAGLQPGSVCIPISPEEPQAEEAVVPTAPHLQEAGLQPGSVCIPISPEEPQAEEAAGSPGPQTNQPISSPDNVGIWRVILSFKNSFDLLVQYLRIKLGVDVQDSRIGSLVITVSCSSLQVLDGLWEDYQGGHLNEVIQKTLVTQEVLKELGLSEMKLKTIISEEEYKACKEQLTEELEDEEEKERKELEETEKVLLRQRTEDEEEKERKELEETKEALPIQRTEELNMKMLKDLREREKLSEEHEKMLKDLREREKRSDIEEMEYDRCREEIGLLEHALQRLRSEEQLKEEDEIEKVFLMQGLEELEKRLKDLREKGKLPEELEKMLKDVRKIKERFEEKLKEEEEEEMEKVYLIQRRAIKEREYDRCREEIEETKHALRRLSSVRARSSPHYSPALSRHYSPESIGDDINYFAKTGYVLVIDNYTPVSVEKSASSHVQPLLDLYGSFGFTIQARNNLTKSAVLKVLEDTAEKDFSNYDCFVCVIVSHGSDGEIYGTDDEVINLEVIMALFNRKRCLKLEGKPKIFLIEAFQGAESPKIPGSGPFVNTSYLEDDFLVCYACSPDPGRFLTSTAEVFELYSRREHISDMMLRVNRRAKPHVKMRQFSTLTRKVFFRNPMFPIL